MLEPFTHCTSYNGNRCCTVCCELLPCIFQHSLFLHWFRLNLIARMHNFLKLNSSQEEYAFNKKFELVVYLEDVCVLSECQHLITSLQYPQGLSLGWHSHNFEDVLSISIINNCFHIFKIHPWNCSTVRRIPEWSICMFLLRSNLIRVMEGE